MLINMIAMRKMKMSIVCIAGVIVVLNRLVTAVWSVLMCMLLMFFT